MMTLQLGRRGSGPYFNPMDGDPTMIKVPHLFIGIFATFLSSWRARPRPPLQFGGLRSADPG